MPITTKLDRKLEHLGDAVVGVAARLLAERLFDDTFPVIEYFKYASALATNSNLKSAGFGSGFEAELHVGKIYKDKGFEAALLEATEMLWRSKVCAQYKAKDELFFVRRNQRHVTADEAREQRERINEAVTGRTKSNLQLAREIPMWGTDGD